MLVAIAVVARVVYVLLGPLIPMLGVLLLLILAFGYLLRRS